MKSKLKRIKIQRPVPGYHDLAVEGATPRQLSKQWRDQFGEETVQRFLIATLDHDLVVIAEDKRPKAIPFRFKDPALTVRKLVYSFGKHGQDRGIDWKPHAFILQNPFQPDDACGPENCVPTATKRARQIPARFADHWKLLLYAALTLVGMPTAQAVIEPWAVWMPVAPTIVVPVSVMSWPNANYDADAVAVMHTFMFSGLCNTWGQHCQCCQHSAEHSKSLEHLSPPVY